MLITSNANNYVNQTNNINTKKTNSNDYLHRAIKLDVPGEQNKIEFRDIESGKLVEINIHEEIQRQLKTKFSVEFENDKTTKATGDFEKYLQTMWSKYQNETNTKDTNNDGYLDKQELLKSKRVSKIGYDDNHKVALFDDKSYSHLEVYGDKAIEEIDKYLQSNGISNGKVSIDMDFNGFINNDLNLDTNFSNKETLLGLDFSEDEINPNILLSSVKIDTENIIQKQLEKWAQGQKDKGLEELYTTNQTNEKNLKDVTKTLEENENFNDINQEKLVGIKENLKSLSNYVNTQADNAKIFSLKV